MVFIAFSWRAVGPILMLDAEMDPYDYQNRILNTLLKKIGGQRWRFLVDIDRKYAKSAEMSCLEASGIVMFAVPSIFSRFQFNREHIT